MTRRWMMTLCAAALLIGGCSDDGPATAAVDSAPGVAVDAPSPTLVEMVTTEGTMVVELFPQHMPLTVANFLSYVDSNFYDGTLIHRVDDDWVIQGGGWTTGLRPKTPNAPIQFETSPMVGHVHGAISMARKQDPDSADSQWFIVDWPVTGPPRQPGQLDGSFAAFGVVVQGLDVLAAITQVATQTTATMGMPPNPTSLEDVPVTEIVVTSMTRR